MNHIRVRHQIILVMSVALCTAGAAHADTLEVPVPFSTIQDCIDAATDGDECVVADGVFTGPGNRDLDFGGKAITLRSQSGDPASCVIDCELAGRFALFTMGDTAVVEDLTIRNGNTAGAGGAALVLNAASPAFHNCVFEANTAGDDGGAIYASEAFIELVDTEFDGNEGNRGGAVFVDGGEITISKCTFTLNSSGPAWSGGAVRALGGALVNCTNSLFDSNTSGSGGGGMLANVIDPASVISGCQFTNNQAPNGIGGGLMLDGDDGAYLISECVFEGNVAIGTGGGLLIQRGGPASRVQNCIFRANEAQMGGGAQFGMMSSTTIANCLFHQNVAAASEGYVPLGGAVNVGNSMPILINCTLVGNHSDDLGGGIGVMNNAHPELVGCVLWDNDAPIGPEIALGSPVSGDGTLTISYSDVEGGEPGVSISEASTLNWGAGNIDEDPLFVDPDGPDDDSATWQDNDYHLAAGSPCVDAGDNTGLVPFGCGDCDTPQETPGCSNTECETNVCDIDPFCCDTQWDGTCVNEAIALCGCGVVAEEITTDLDGAPRSQNDLDTVDTGNGGCPIVDMGSYEFPATCPADIDCDESVGVTDLLGLLALWGPCPACAADLDGDGIIGIGDLLALLASWGPCI